MLDDVLQNSTQELGITVVQYPRPVLLPAAHGISWAWPATRGSKAASNERKERTRSPLRPAPMSMIPQEEANNRINNAMSSFRNEIDAHVEQERNDWAAELV